MLFSNQTTQSNYINLQCGSIAHENNYQLIKLLLPVQLYQGVSYQSALKHKPMVNIKVTQEFKYTTEIELNYQFSFGESEKLVLRVYNDAQVAEITYCTDFQQFIRLLGPKVNHKIHLETRASLNSFLSKLLHFLLKSGYNHNHWIQLPTKS
jgi:uncharacterized protein YqiB (DUF1249 family)